MPVEVVTEDSRWNDLGLEDIAEKVSAEALAYLGLDPDICEITLLACDDARIAVLNAEFRDKSQPTNVLSWPIAELAPEREGEKPDLPEPDITGEMALGDIAIAYETCAREAAESGKSLSAHSTHLVLHGLLHLLGYDHIRDGDATLMEGLETTILGRLGLDDPYSD
ncbi:MAG: rRNA maturation RNase YbeY [Heliomarina sp.]|uniref:rRNA maturation RNase YbeY n=1 Tax=Heliomarina sp. TaxID=2917556 RepID=UPI0040580BA2